MAVGKGERIFLHGAWTVIAVMAALGLFRSFLPSATGGASEPEEPAADAAPAPPHLRVAPPDPLFPVLVRGRLVELPGQPIDPGILRWTRLRLWADGRALGDGGQPAVDGSFELREQAPLPGLRLRISTELHFHRFDRSVWRDVPIAGIRSDLGEIPLPRVDGFGSVYGAVIDASGVALTSYGVELDADESTPTPDIGLARMGALLDHAANAPTLYRDGAGFRILHVPPGTYWLRARAVGRLLPAVRVFVSSGETQARLAETSTRRRLRGSVLDALAREPLGDVEISIGTADFAGPATRDPLRVLGRTSIDGRYDLPLPETLPPGGVSAAYSKAGYRAESILLSANDFDMGLVARRHLELGRP